jgi:Fe-S cluster assembly protein SufD
LRQAQALLVLAFLAEALGEIDDEVIAEDVRSRLEGWLARHDH